MIINCPNCGSEIEVTTESFKSFVNSHPGFRDIVMEWMKSDTNIFEDVREFVYKEMEEQRKAEREAKKARRKEAETIKDQMDPDDLIEFLNTPYKDQPEWLRAHNLPQILMEGMTKYPQVFNFVRFNQPNVGKQIETAGARCLRFRKDYDLSREEFAKLCNIYAKQFDLPKTEKHRAQRTRVKESDVAHYERDNISPKIDKMTVIGKATNIPITYFAGYGPDNVLSKNDILAARYRKNRKSRKTSA